MKRNFPKPKIFISKCLGQGRCRWNGETITDEFVSRLTPFVDVVSTCPECEIGLGVPRDPIRIVWQDNSRKLMQLNTGRDVTEPMTKFTAGYLKSLSGIDGFILKDRSPSCGIKEVRIYPSLRTTSVLKKGSGFFGGEVIDRFSGVVVESEARLTNFSIREHFLTRIFAAAEFRRVLESGKIKDLGGFRNKQTLLSRYPKSLSEVKDSGAGWSTKK